MWLNPGSCKDLRVQEGDQPWSNSSTPHIDANEEKTENVLSGREQLQELIDVVSCGTAGMIDQPACSPAYCSMNAASSANASLRRSFASMTREGYPTRARRGKINC
jgi:hypothetical protein